MATQYAAISDLQNVLNPSVLSFFTTAQQNAALLAASEMFDSKARQHFTPPYTSVGADVIDFVCNVAAYRLMRLRGFKPEPGSADEVVLDAYKEAIAWATGISEGNVTPDIIDSSPGGVVGGVFVTSSPQRGFSNRGNTATDPGTPFNGG